MKKIYLVRHCQAEGQEPKAKLTALGREQAIQLAEFFHSIEVDRIISSPYDRAQESIKFLANQKGIEITLDPRLVERVLSTKPQPNWLEMLKETYEDLHKKFDGGESSEEAVVRGIAIVKELLTKGDNRFILVTHGNLMSLILRYFDQTYGFDQWAALTNPDVFLLEFEEEGKVLITRVWDI
ncbi:histidine phosphatase family protein [Bacillus sp. 31A1R]|uniref:Histidine phosphatase family protein n=1 Tax=Robertmurraya mangrovi TaxID=3098077 RepID=A0ABU5J2T6_9BACI|nr:histidine phosphatase family protein [Bacillus sp. 31A1R]MDZ5473723.1 histidine phosphatase family protein [Bacillus sp. 31A1R]